MKWLCGIVGALLCMVPMLSFLTAAVVLVLRGHPRFATALLAMTLFVLPKIELGGSSGTGGKNDKKGDTTDE